jgi:O-antigen/teichoic acid export membrane protein
VREREAAGLVQRVGACEVSSGTVEARAAKVAFASGLSTFLSVALQLLSVPICLRYWGNETYGLWLALFSLFNVLRTLDGGYSAYVGNELNLLYHRDQDALRKTLASGIAGAIVLGIGQLAATIAIAASGRLPDLLGVAPEVARDQRAALALAVMVGGWALTGPYLGIVHRLQVPAGLLHQATWWLMGFQIAQAAALVCAAALRLEISGAAVLMSAAQVGVYLATAIYVARKLPQFFPWWKGPSFRHGLRDLYRSIALVGANVMIQVGTSGVVMLISSGLSAAVVPAFTTVRTVANVWTSLGNALVSPMVPEIVRYHALRDGKKLVAAVEAYWLIANNVMNLSVLVCFPFFAPLYHYWTGGRVELDQSLLCYLLLSVVAATPLALITNYLVSINELRATAAIFAARGLVPIAAGLALLPSFGIAGVGVAIALGEILGPIGCGLPYFRRELRKLGEVPDIPAWQPTVTGSVSVAVFLIARASDSPFADAAYVLAFVGVIASAVWSWSRVGADVRQRALRLLRRSAK